MNDRVQHRLHARVRLLAHRLRADAGSLDLLHAILADLDVRLLVHIPPPAENGQEAGELVPRRPQGGPTEDWEPEAWWGRPDV